MKKSNVSLIIIFSFIITYLYYLVNKCFFWDIDNMYNYLYLLFFMFYLIYIINDVINVKNFTSYANYLEYLDDMFVERPYWTGRHRYAFDMRSVAKESLRYLKSSKILFILISTGKLSLLTIFWHLLQYSNSKLFEGIWVLVLSIVSVTFLLFIPISLLVLTPYIKTSKIIKSQTNKNLTKGSVEKIFDYLFIFVILLLFFVFNVFLIRNGMKDFFLLIIIDLVIFCFLGLLYLSIKSMIKILKKRNKR